MKKGIIVLIVAVLVLASAGFWFFSDPGKINLADIAGLGVIIMVVALAIYMGYRKISSARRGEPGEDELSRKVMQKTASLSFYISIYLWLAIMYFSDRLHYEIHTIIGTGILGMAIIFALCWIVINFRGIRNE